VSDETARVWSDGIRDNLRLPTFQTAWEHLEDGLPGGYFTQMASVVGELKRCGAWRLSRT
jgi:hypothetical protein